jgi:hypothetical protein
MGWGGAGLGAKEQGIEQPISGGEVGIVMCWFNSWNTETVQLKSLEVYVHCFLLIASCTCRQYDRHLRYTSWCNRMHRISWATVGLTRRILLHRVSVENLSCGKCEKYNQ